jgi:predicted MPP superfamily phosphohydrolase
MTPLGLVARSLGAGAVAGAGLAAYSVWESRAFTLRCVTTPVLPVGAHPLRVLHLSDIHMTPRQSRKQEWLRSLADLQPDLVVNTGDNLAHLEALPPVLDSLGPLLDVPGVFVLGSNDYFEPVLRNPLRYLLPDDGSRNTRSAKLRWQELKDAYSAAGWLDLTNRRASTTVGDLSIAWAGVDDPHLEYDDLVAVGGQADPSADLRVGVTHAPYLRVLDQYAADGYDLVFAGHTHGGQVCLPLWGALVTNCDLEPARAKGLHRHPADSRPGDPGSAWLHVSAGLGTSPYTPFRIACRPEATLLTLTPRA